MLSSNSTSTPSTSTSTSTTPSISIPSHCVPSTSSGSPATSTSLPIPNACAIPLYQAAPHNNNNNNNNNNTHPNASRVADLMHSCCQQPIAPLTPRSSGSGGQGEGDGFGDACWIYCNITDSSPAGTRGCLVRSGIGGDILGCEVGKGGMKSSASVMETPRGKVGTGVKGWLVLGVVLGAMVVGW